MKFRLITSGTYYTYKHKIKLEKLGFQFFYSEDWKLYCININHFVYIDLESLEDLIVFCKEYGGDLVLSDGNIEIYDAYRE